MNNKKILYIGNNENILKLCKYHLQKLDYELVHLNDKMEITKTINNIDFCTSMILMEMKLGENYCFEYCSLIRKHPKLFKVPILVLSEYNFSFHKEDYDTSGANGYLMLPFRIDDLLTSIKTLAI